MKLFSKSFRISYSLIIIFCINLFLTFLPLTNTLGYELSVVNAFLLFIIGGMKVISSQRKNYLKGFNSFLYKEKLYFILSILIPFIIGFISSRINSQCPLSGGIFFFLLITIPAYFLGIILGYFCVSLSKKYPYVFFILSFILIIISSLIEFYINPQIYFYNPIVGFFPGTIYDEDLSVDKFLISYRLFNLAFCAVIVFISSKINSQRIIKKILSASILIIITAIFFFLKPSLQYSTNKNRLDKNLPTKITTKNFEIHLPDTIKDKNVLNYAALLHEYYFAQIQTELQLTYRQKIDSYIFATSGQKRELMGAGNANVAKPWLNQIYLNYNIYDIPLKHELTHVVASQFGFSPFKVARNFNSAIIEGMAMAIENNFNNYPVHYMAKLAREAGYKFPIEKLFSGLNFFTQSSNISYIFAGSFIKYLADQYGIEKVKRIYGESDFEKVYGPDIKTLAKKYYEFLKEYPIEFNKDKAQFYFGGVTIFKKYCPRMAAADVKKASKLYREKNVSESLELFKKVFAYSNSYQSLSGIVACYSKQKKYSEAETLLRNQFANFRTSQYRYIMELNWGDLLIECGRLNEANAIYDSLLIQNPHILYENEVLIRKEILKDGIDSLKIYFDKNDKQKYQKLLDMNKSKIKYFTIPSLIEYANRSKENPAELFIKSRRKISVTDYTSCYAIFEMSKYFLENADYKNAQDFAAQCLELKADESSKYLFNENMKMVNWFQNNAEELKKSFIIK